MTITANVVGASGYLGGELLRLLLGHPEVRVAQALSTRLHGRRVDAVHPNLRAVTGLTFTALEDLAQSDVLFLASPHRATMDLLPRVMDRARLVIDLSGDFRLTDARVYAAYYATPHAAPHLLGAFTPGLPELYRDDVAKADLISVPGCSATAATLALAPLRGLVAPEVQADTRTGSSGSGAAAGEANTHAERSGALRVFAPARHRHEAEVAAHTGLSVRMTATGTPAVRGVQVICHATASGSLTEREVRGAYREAYEDEPFVRVVAHRRGAHRLPDPRVLLGSNFCDVGFALDGDRVTAIGALDNLVKGGAGAAVQCLNLRLGLPEALGLDFPGLHPV